MQFACIHDKSFIKGEMYGCSTWLLQMEGYHPQTQGKIERWHRSMKNQILLDNYYLPGQLKAALQQFVDYYNHERYHESLNWSGLITSSVQRAYFPKVLYSPTPGRI